MITSDTFIEVGHYQICKHKQVSPGDMFLSQKSNGRVITTLSDGLGSGIKANVLATLTATMATNFVASDIPIKRAAEIIMNTLPVCKERGISYATFTLVDIEPNSNVRIIEYDNPPYILVRSKTIIDPIKEQTRIERKNKKTAPKIDAILNYSSYEAKPGDRIIFFSDGVTQAGMGGETTPFGLGHEDVQDFVLQKIENEPFISARDLARDIVNNSLFYDKYTAKDDITCGVIYFREPRKMIVLSGPPLNPENDKEFASLFENFEGKKVVCGGSTANIVARELNKKVNVDFSSVDIKNSIPPYSKMEGADLVTEGIITLSMVEKILENDEGSGSSVFHNGINAATKLVDLFLDSDCIKFVVGTKINEAHQDPNMPVELEIRRNIIKRIQLIISYL